jgi:hypothetical protein
MLWEVAAVRVRAHQRPHLSASAWLMPRSSSFAVSCPDASLVRVMTRACTVQIALYVGGSVQGPQAWAAGMGCGAVPTLSPSARLMVMELVPVRPSRTRCCTSRTCNTTHIRFLLCGAMQACPADLCAPLLGLHGRWWRLRKSHHRGHQS